MILKKGGNEMKRRILAVILTVLTIMTMSANVFAAMPEEQVVPLWDNMNEITVNLVFDDDDVGTASVKVSRIFGVTTSIEGTLTVYRKSGTQWIYVTETSGEANGTLYIDVDFNATSGTTYKAVADITAYSSTSSESETVSKISTC